MTTQAELTALLYTALAEPIGLLLATSDTEHARQRLYQARAKAADPALAGLQFRASPLAGGDLLIVNSTIGARRAPTAEDLLA